MPIIGSPPMPMQVDWPMPSLRQLMHGLVRQGSAAAHDAHVSLLVNPPRHDPHLAFSRRNNSRTVRPDQARLGIFQHGRHADHVERGNAFRDANDERHAGIDRLENRVRGKRRRHKNYGRVRARFANRVRNGVEHVHVLVLRASLARRNARDHRSAVFNHLLRVEAAFAPGEGPARRRAFFHSPTRSFAHSLRTSSARCKPADPIFPLHLSFLARS